MNIDVTIQGNKTEYYFGQVPMVRIVKLNAIDMINLCTLAKNFDVQLWLVKSIKESKKEFKNDLTKLISEAEIELIKAKALMKSNYPVRYKLSYYKVILKNPLKTLYAKWRLK